MVAGTADRGEHHDEDDVHGEGEQDGAEGMTHPSILSAMDRLAARTACRTRAAGSHAV